MAWRAQHGEVDTWISVEDHEIGRRAFAEPGWVAEPGASAPGTRAQRVLSRAELPQRGNLLADQAMRQEATGVSAGINRDAGVQGFGKSFETGGICLAYSGYLSSPDWAYISKLSSWIMVGTSAT